MPMPKTITKPPSISEDDFDEVCQVCHIHGNHRRKLKVRLGEIVAKAKGDIRRKTPSYKSDRTQLKKASAAIASATTALKSLGPCADFGLDRARGDLHCQKDAAETPREIILKALRILERTVDRAVTEMAELPDAAGGHPRNLAKQNVLESLYKFYAEVLGRPVKFGPRSKYIEFCEVVFAGIGWEKYTEGTEGLQGAAKAARPFEYLRISDL